MLVVVVLVGTRHGRTEPESTSLDKIVWRRAVAAD